MTLESGDCGAGWNQRIHRHHQRAGGDNTQPPNPDPHEQRSRTRIGHHRRRRRSAHRISGSARRPLRNSPNSFEFGGLGELGDNQRPKARSLAERRHSKLGVNVSRQVKPHSNTRFDIVDFQFITCLGHSQHLKKSFDTLSFINTRLAPWIKKCKHFFIKPERVSFHGE